MDLEDNTTENKPVEEPKVELPPFAKTWNQLYAVVIIELVGLIGLFYWFTKAFE